MIVFRRYGSRKILPTSGKIFAEDETGLKRMALQIQIVKQAT